MIKNRLMNLKRVVVIMVLSGFLLFPTVILGKCLVSATSGWQILGTLPESLGDGVAFILGDTLYHAGGRFGNSDQHTAAIYSQLLSSSSTSTVPWSQTHTLPGVSRFGAAVAVYEEYAYVLGGYNKSVLDRVDIFDGTDNWKMASLLEPLNFPAATVSNGYLYVAGGLPGPSKKVWRTRIDASNGNLLGWEPDAELDLGLMTSLATHGTCLYAIGGWDNAGTPHSEIYAAVVDQNDGHLSPWEYVADLPLPLALHDVTVQRGQLYIVGGQTTNDVFSNLAHRIKLPSAAPCDIDDTMWESFTLPSSMSLSRMAIASRWGELYMIGGQLANGSFSDQVWYLPLDVPPATLELAKVNTPSGPVGYGETIDYTLNYANPWESPDPQTNVRIVDTLPEGTEFVAASDGISPDAANRLVWELGALDSGTGGSVTFTVQTIPPTYTWSLTTTQQSNYVVGSMQAGVIVSHTIAYTLAAGDTRPGLLVTHTLPTGLVPLRITADAQYFQSAVHGQDVVWRILDTITAGDSPGRLTVTACISGSLQSGQPLTRVTTLNDSLTTTVVTLAQPISSGSNITLGHSCPPPQSMAIKYNGDLAPLYPDVSVSNQAVIYSDQVPGGQASETVLNIWPGPWKIYLPVIKRH